MKNLRFFLIPLLFICGVLLLSLLLRWIASPNSEETQTDLQTQAEAPAYTRWHLPEGATLRLGKGHIKDIKFVPDGTQFIVAASTGIWLYDAQTGAEIARLNEKPRNIKTIAFSPDGKTLISSDSEGQVQMWDISTAKRHSTLRGPQKITNAVSVASADGITLANEQRRHIRLWKFRPNTTEPIVTDTNSDSKFGYGTVVMTLSPDATRLAATSSDGHEIYPIWLWDANTGELLFTLEGHTRWIRALAFSPDSKTLASGDIRNTIRLWDMDTRTPRGNSRKRMTDELAID
jgi:WD40 repeat protein